MFILENDRGNYVCKRVAISYRTHIECKAVLPILIYLPDELFKHILQLHQAWLSQYPFKPNLDIRIKKQ